MIKHTHCTNLFLSAIIRGSIVDDSEQKNEVELFLLQKELVG